MIADNTPTLHCSRCSRDLRPAAFMPNARMRSGRSSWCRSCALAATRQWRARNRDALNAARRVHYPARPCAAGCGVVLSAPKRVDSIWCCAACRMMFAAAGRLPEAWAESHRSHCGVSPA